jgi:DNA processing protein
MWSSPKANADLQVAELAVLAGLPGMGPRRLRMLLSHFEPSEALQVLARPDKMSADLRALYPQDLRERWANAVQSCDLGPVMEHCTKSGIDAARFGSAQYPLVLLADPVPPAVIFWRGDLSLLSARRVGIVGTRHPTRSGVATAGTLAQELAEAGVAVVSGLALGIDGAAHRGALSAGGRAIAVVGNGPDRPYPRAHTQLWNQVCSEGVLISEWPPGVAPDAYRFPMRNRILAALSEVIVVVESRETGGSLSTVREALLRGITVMAVPGSLHTRASSGTNQLLCDGAVPVTCTDDVLVALGLTSMRRSDGMHDPRPMCDELGRRILERCQLRPQTLDDLCQGLSIAVGTAALAVARLERDGWVGESGGWFEILGPWAGSESDQTSSSSEAIPYGS